MNNAVQAENQILGRYNFSCRVVGIGRMALRYFDGDVKILNNVRHIPDLRRNLISLGVLED